MTIDISAVKAAKSSYVQVFKTEGARRREVYKEVRARKDSAKQTWADICKASISTAETFEDMWNLLQVAPNSTPEKRMIAEKCLELCSTSVQARKTAKECWNLDAHTLSYLAVIRWNAVALQELEKADLKQSARIYKNSPPAMFCRWFPDFPRGQAIAFFEAQHKITRLSKNPEEGASLIKESYSKIVHRDRYSNNYFERNLVKAWEESRNVSTLEECFQKRSIACYT